MNCCFPVWYQCGNTLEERLSVAEAERLAGIYQRGASADKIASARERLAAFESRLDLGTLPKISVGKVTAQLVRGTSADRGNAAKIGGEQAAMPQTPARADAARREAGVINSPA